MPNRDEHGNLTREGMEAAIKAGGSVVVNGKTITKVEDLPRELPSPQPVPAAPAVAPAIAPPATPARPKH